MSTSTRARTRAVRERQRRTGEPYSLALRNVRPEPGATVREDAVPWHAVLAVLDERSDYGDERTLRTPPGGRVRTETLPLSLTIGREPGTSSPPAACGLVAKVWTQPSPYSNQGTYLMGRGTAWGPLGQALKDGASFPIEPDVDGEAAADGRGRGETESWRLRGATVLIPGVHQPSYASARIWLDPVPALKVPRTDPAAAPVRLPHVPLPAPGEELAIWIARVGSGLHERRQGVTMNLLGLEAGASPVRRIRELAERVEDRTAALFTMATGLDARMLRAMAEASAASAHAHRRKSADAAVIAARRDLVAVLTEAMAASCPPGADGYGGQLALQSWKMTRDAVLEVRAAMRKAGRSLGWKVHTFAYDHREVTWVCVSDERKAPPRAAQAISRARASELSDAMQQLRGVDDLFNEPGPRAKTDAAPDSDQQRGFDERMRALLGVICG